MTKGVPLEPRDAANAVGLSEPELSRLIRRTTGVAPPPRLVAVLHRRLGYEPRLLIDLMRSLLIGGRGALAALAELAIAADPAGGGTGICRREGEYWTIIFDAAVVRLHDSKGLEYLARLLSRPGERIPASDLAATAGSEIVRRQNAEQARLAVTKALKGVLARLHKCHPTLASHLSATIHSGRTCGYHPDPRQPIRWETEDPPQ